MGVTVIVAVFGFKVLLDDKNAGTLPAPLAPKPIVISELVQAKVAPAVVLVKVVAGIVKLAQTAMSAGTTTTGLGLIVIV